MNNDGVLSKEELTKGFTQLYGSEERATMEVENILEKVDLNQNGSIDYSGKLIRYHECYQNS